MRKAQGQVNPHHRVMGIINQQEYEGGGSQESMFQFIYK